MTQMILSTKQKQIIAKEGQPVLAMGEWEGVGWTGSLGLVVANCYMWNGWAMGPYSAALGHFAVQQKLKKHCKSAIYFFFEKKKPQMLELPGFEF